MARTRRQKAIPNTKSGGEATEGNNLTGTLEPSSNLENNTVNDDNPLNREIRPESIEDSLNSHVTDTNTLNQWLNVIVGSNGKRTAVPEKPQYMEFTMAKIEMEDIEEEVTYWSSTLVCYVLGANPPFTVFNGYCNRKWGKQGLDKVAMVGKGLFLVRFHTVEQCETILSGEPQFFDSRPIIWKKWDSDLDVHKETIRSVPVWIRLPQLDLKYWGTRCLHKLGDSIGTTIKVDNLTEQRERLAFARIMVEIGLDKELPDEICFQNEKGICVQQPIEYEWRPVLCTQCKRYGHRADDCKKGDTKGKQVWKPKPHAIEKGPTAQQLPVNGTTTNQEKLTPVQQGKKPQPQMVTPHTPVQNSFGILSDQSDEEDTEDGDDVDKGEYGDRGLTGPDHHG